MIAKKHLGELIVFFIFYPIFLAISEIPVQYKLIVTIIPTTFILQKSIKYRKALFKKRKQVKPLKFWLKVSYRSLIIFTATFAYIKYTNPDLLFKSILTQPDLWIKMMLVYTFLSVIPQEFIYRVFFFYRYRKLARKPELFYLWNALLFSIAHLMFHSWLVLVVTFIGGYIFAYTYSKTKSWFWVCVEHTLYGGWLFTVGLGKMLGFPI